MLPSGGDEEGVKSHGFLLPVLITLLSVLGAISFEILINIDQLVVESFGKSSNDCPLDQIDVNVSPKGSGNSFFEFDACIQTSLNTHVANAFKWLILLATGMNLIAVLWLAQKAAENIRMRERQLIEAVSTMPPTSVLDILRVALDDIRWHENYLSERLEKYKNLKNRDRVDKFKRMFEDKIILYCLDCIAVMARQYNPSLSPSRYATNIMLAKNPKNMTNEEIEDTDSKVMRLMCAGDGEEYVSFVRRSIGLFLFLEKRYSTSTDSDRYDVIDDKLEENLVLYVPKEIHVNGKSNVLPGAPTAVSSKLGYDQIPNTAKILQEYQDSKKSCVDEKVVRDTQAYFNDERNDAIRSVVSIGLFDYMGEEAIGSINIHSDSVEMFKNVAHLHTFVSLITPLRRVIYDLI